MPGFYKTSKIPMSLRFNINNNSWTALCDQLLPNRSC
jgi:hypothetical protein